MHEVVVGHLSPLVAIDDCVMSERCAFGESIAVRHSPLSSIIMYSWYDDTKPMCT